MKMVDINRKQEDNMENKVRTMDELLKSVLEDEEWDMPKEERAMYLNKIEWAINQL